MAVREFKDKEWDSRYEQFKRLKEQRRQAENAPVANNPIVRPENTVRTHRNDMAAKKEERIFVNKGPSRFVRSHSENQQREAMKAQQVKPVSTPVVQLIKEESDSEGSAELIVNQEETKENKIRLSFMEIVPYLFIILGILIVVLKLAKVF